MDHDKKKFLVAAGVVLAGVIGLALQLRESPIPVDLHEVRREQLVVTIDEEGVSKIRDVFKVSASIAGRVLRNPLKVSDPVIKGKTVVATIEPVAPSLLDECSRQTIQARVQAAQSAVEFARANVTRMKADLEFRRKEFWRAQLLSASKPSANAVTMKRAWRRTWPLPPSPRLRPN